MKIAFFTDTFFPQINGVTNTLGYLSAYLTKRGIEHLFFAPEYPQEPDAPCDLPVIRFKGLAPRIYPECSIALPSYFVVMSKLKEFAPDVVHIVTEVGVGLSGLRAARALGIPVVMSYHTDFDKYLDFYNLKYLSNPLWGYMKWFHSFAEVNLCPSRDTLQCLEQRGIERLGIWSRGIDGERFSPEHASAALRSELGGEGKTVFLYVGRVAKEKGLDVLANSIKALNEKHQDHVLFVFTGDGPYLEELKNENIPNVCFTGAKRGRELSQIYASADAFVFPSGTETFGNVALEAMASGLPVVCVNAGGVTDFTRHHENAVVCEYGDGESLTQGIEQMLNPVLRAKLQQGALATAARRSWPAIFDGLMEHYHTAAEKAAVAVQSIAG